MSNHLTTAEKGEGYHDKWIVYGKVDSFQNFIAKELTVEPGTTVTIKDNGAYSLIVVQAALRPPLLRPGSKPQRSTRRLSGNIDHLTHNLTYA